MNNDLISREALLKAFANSEHIKETDSGLDVMEMLAIKEIIDNAPAVDMNTELSVAYLKGRMQGQSEDRPQGEWKVLVDADNIQTCKCSICGRMVDIGNRQFDKYPYCHCGARMIVGKEE